MKLTLIVIALTVAASARATEVRLPGGPKSEDALRKFVETNPALKAKLSNLSEREEAFVAEARDGDLHDAVSEANGPEKLKNKLAQLPGMQAPAPGACRVLAECATPELALDVPNAELLPGALRRLVRPWMLLQKARGADIRIAPADTGGDAVLSVKTKGLDVASLTLNVTPRLMGGFTVWYDQPLVLASVYGRARDAALKSSR